jgi:biotin carboxyl carrier protein
VPVPCADEVYVKEEKKCPKSKRVTKVTSRVNGNADLRYFPSLEVGDFVAQDEEVATIETDKVDVTVNSPASGTIIEVYAQEEDNVAVGGDFFKLELGDAPKEGKVIN